MKDCIAFLEDAKTFQCSVFQYVADLGIYISF